MNAAEIRRRVLDMLDRWDDEHETSGCPAKVGECIHSAATAVRAVLATSRSERTLAAVAEALGIDTKEREGRA
jgi:hypothetical protein